MTQSGYIAALLLAGFVLFLAARDRLGKYASVLWGNTAALTPAETASKPTGGFPMMPGIAPPSGGFPMSGFPGLEIPDMPSLPGIADLAPLLLEAIAL